MSVQLEHLLSVLHEAEVLMDEAGRDIDARVLEAHRAQLARGKEWPGDPVAPVVFSDGSTNGVVERMRMLPGGAA